MLTMAPLCKRGCTVSGGATACSPVVAGVLQTYILDLRKMAGWHAANWESRQQYFEKDADIVYGNKCK